MRFGVNPGLRPLFFPGPGASAYLCVLCGKKSGISTTEDTEEHGGGSLQIPSACSVYSVCPPIGHHNTESEF
jgi:hypothetical protein